jgi:hypothetical protein
MNKTDFLNAICGKSVVRQIDGIEVEIKALTVLEVQQLQASTDPVDQSMQMIIAGLVNPQLDKDDIESLKAAKAGFIAKLAREISELSGLSDGDSPTVGNG